MASNITLRIPKGSKLSYEEGDNNFRDILKLYRFTEDTPTAAGTSDSITITSFNQPVAGYLDNMFLGFKASADNTTTTPTLDVDGNGPIVIERGTGAPLQAGDISTGLFYVVRYNQSTNTFRLFGQGGGVDEFIELTDVPNSYTGSSGLAVAVNGTEDGLEFVPFPSAPVTSVNTLTGDVVLDYGDFAGTQNATLNNTIAWQGRTSGGTARSIGFINSSNETILANNSLPTLILSNGVPQTNYGGNTYDLITTEGGQTISGDLTLSGTNNDTFFSTSSVVFLDAHRRNADNIEFRMRNDEGGVTQRADSGNFQILQTDDLGIPGNTWAGFMLNGAANFYYNGTLRLSTSLTGASVEGTTLEINTVEYTWPSADGTNGQALTTDGAGTLTWATAGGQVDSVVGGDNITVDSTDPVNPIVNLDSSQTHVTFDLNTTNATGTANTISAGTNGVIEWDWDGTNTSVALQHNGSDSLVVDENGITLNQALNFSASANISVTGSYDLTATSFAQFISDSGTDHSEVVLNGASARFNAGDPTGLGNGSLNLNAYLDSGVLSCNLFFHATGGPSATGQSTLTIAGNTAYQIRDNSGTLQQAWFGATPVAQQSIDSSDTDTNRITALEAALEAYGLVVDTAP